MELFLQQKYTIKEVTISDNLQNIEFTFSETDMKLYLSSEINGYGGPGYYYGNDLETINETLHVCVGKRLVNIVEDDIETQFGDWRTYAQKIHIYFENFLEPVEIFMITDVYYSAYVTMDII